MASPSGNQVDEKTTVQPQVSSGLDHPHSHQEVTKMGSEETSLHESEKDIPVRDHRIEIGVHHANRLSS